MAYVAHREYDACFSHGIQGSPHSNLGSILRPGSDVPPEKRLLLVTDIQILENVDPAGISRSLLASSCCSDSFYSGKAYSISHKPRSAGKPEEDTAEYKLAVFVHCIDQANEMHTLKIYDWRPWFFVTLADELPHGQERFEPSLERAYITHALRSLDPWDAHDLEIEMETRVHAHWWEPDSQGNTRRWRTLRVKAANRRALERATNIARHRYQPRNATEPIGLLPMRSGFGLVAGVYEYDTYECKLSTKFTDDTGIGVGTLFEFNTSQRGIRRCTGENLHTFDSYEWEIVGKINNHIQVVDESADVRATKLALVCASFDIEQHNHRWKDNPDSAPIQTHTQDPITAIGTSVGLGPAIVGRYVFALLPPHSECPKAINEAAKWFMRTPEPLIDNILQSNDASSPEDCVWWFESEREMIMAWRDWLVHVVNPVSILSYNGFNYDIPTICNRLGLLGRFNYMGRSPCIPSGFDKGSRMQTTGAKGSLALYALPSRWLIDMYPIARQNCKLLETKKYCCLANAAREFLPGCHEEATGKIDLSYTEMDAMWELSRWEPFARKTDGTSACRTVFIRYNQRDADLPLRLAYSSLSTHEDLLAMARVTSTTIVDLLALGQSIKVTNQKLIHGHKKGYIYNSSGHRLIPFPGQTQLPDDVRWKPRPPRDADESTSKRKKGVKRYEGGLVLTPKRGIYYEPVVVLDFASLYPTLIIAYLLCASRLVHPSLVALVKQLGVSLVEHKVHPTRSVWLVGPSVAPGLLPQIENHLLNERAAVKTAMKKCGDDPARYETLNRRQLAIKVSANSHYGVLGAEFGASACIPIAELITWLGRNSNEETQKYVLELFPDAQIVYGDTDSVMVKFAGLHLENFSLEERQRAIAEAFRLGNQVADEISKRFPDPMELEMEKTYLPYILPGKQKCYAGLVYMRPPKTLDDVIGQADKQKKGLKSTKRDTTNFTASVLDGLIEKLLEFNPEGALAFVREKILDARQLRVPLQDLVFSKSLKPFEFYEASRGDLPVHVQVAEKIRERTPELALHPGDRVRYVYVQRNKLNSKAGEKAESYDYALKHKLVPDMAHYLENELQTQLLQITDFLLPSGTDGYGALLLDTIRELENARMGQRQITTLLNIPPQKRKNDGEVAKNPVKKITKRTPAKQLGLMSAQSRTQNQKPQGNIYQSLFQTKPSFQ